MGDAGAKGLHSTRGTKPGSRLTDCSVIFYVGLGDKVESVIGKSVLMGLDRIVVRLQSARNLPKAPC
jgi:hypothetical protein